MPRGQKPTQTEKTIDINVVKKYLEDGYITNWGEGYIWNDNKVVLRRPTTIPFSTSLMIKQDEVKLYDFVIISKYDIIDIQGTYKLTIN